MHKTTHHAFTRRLRVVDCACSRQPGNPVAGPFIVVSHRSADSDLARDIAEALKGRGHDVRGAEVGYN